MSLLLLQLVGAVCLLLWGTRHVRVGFTRAYGMSLRNIIHQGTRNRILAFSSGLVVTGLLQSSTATAYLLTSFAKKNMITLPAALAVILGADVSTTLVAQVLSFDISALAPLLLIIGITGRIFYEDHGGYFKHVANIFIGLGFMLMSLGMIREISEPIKHSEILPLIIEPLHHDFVFAILISALLTWLIHSSLATVLLFASFAANGIISFDLGVLMILGANLGGAIIPFAATYKDGIAARRITFSNILMRLTLLLLALPFLSIIKGFFADLPGDSARHLIHFHTGFNLAVALVFLPIIPLIAFLSKKIFPTPQQNNSDSAPLYLDEKSLDMPTIALAGAARETLRISELVEGMLEKTIKALEVNDHRLITQIRNLDNKVDTIYTAIKNYMSRLSQEGLDPQEADRYMQILTFATNMEHVGDIIEKNLMGAAQKKNRKREHFSEAGFREIKEFHDNVLSNLKLSQTIFLSGDHKLARDLVEKKQDIRKAADATSAQHFKRLSEGVPQTLATSSLHLDIIRDYRRINSYTTRVAYTVLNED